MRKIILLTMIAFCSLSYAQTFVVTPDGLRDSTDTDKTFVVIKAEGKSAKELYDNSIKYINRNYKSPNDVIKGKIEGEFLSFITLAKNAFTIKYMGLSMSYDLDYSIEIYFKEGKIKLEIISNKFHHDTAELCFIEDNSLIYYCRGIYNKKGKLLRPDAKNGIEIYFNSQIKYLTDAINGKSNNDNW